MSQTPWWEDAEPGSLCWEGDDGTRWIRDPDGIHWTGWHPGEPGLWVGVQASGLPRGRLHVVLPASPA